jgi:multiple sugar transport system substrate-binding protein
MKKWGFAVAALAVAGVSGGHADAWTLSQAAAPYKGETITVVGLDRPSYKIAQQLTPEFEKATGIHVVWDIFPYEDTLKEETLNFVSNSQQFDAILSDVVWPVNFVDPGWVVPMSHFTSNPQLVDPALDQKDFFSVWLASFTVNNKLYGFPFDSYAGLLYYNKSMLKAAGFNSPPTTWNALEEDYAPKLTNASAGISGYALQSARGETQTADSFTRFLWPWGGRYLDIANKKVLVNSPQAIQGIEFRQSLLKYMPDGIVSDDHPQVVEMLAQGKVAMITEWSAFYPTLSASGLGSNLGIAPEPTGPNGAYAAFGGFAYMVSSQVNDKAQAATYLFIQWLTSKVEAKPLIEGGAVLARVSADTDPSVQADHPNLAPMVATWRTAAVPDWRPQLECYPEFSDIVSDWGSRIELSQVGVRSGLDSMAAKLTDYMNSSDCWGKSNDPEKMIALYK